MNSFTDEELNAIGLGMLVLAGGATSSQEGDMLNTNHILHDQRPVRGSTLERDMEDNRPNIESDVTFAGTALDDMTNVDRTYFPEAESVSWREFAVSMFPGIQGLTEQESAAYRRVRERLFGLN